MLATLARRPQFTFAALALFGSLAFAHAQAQTTPPAPAASPAPPTVAQQPAPIERQPPADSDVQPGPRPRGMMRGNMRPGMQGRMQRPGGPNDNHANFRGGPGAEFRGPQDRNGMGDGHFGPGGMWWKNPMVVQRLTLTPDQVTRMDAIFQKSRIDLIDLKANLEKQEVMLEPLISANPPDTAKATLQIDKVADARASLEKANAKMLLSLRAVLTPDQWTKLRTHDGPGGPGGKGSEGGGNGGRRGPGGPTGMNMDDTRP